MIKNFGRFIKEALDNPQLIATPKPKTTGPDPRRFNKMIDFTYLREDADVDTIQEICKQAKENGFYSVCVRPDFVSYAVNFLEGSGVKICTVISFPEGTDKTQEKVVETQKCIANGADEIDMVLNWKLLQKWSKESDDQKKGDLEQRTYDDIRKIADVCHGADSVVLKVIIESGELTLDQVKKACELCSKAGVDFVKTSTGYASKGAEIDKVRFMRSILPDHIKIKASGGIRTVQDIEAFVNAGADRIGTSSNPAVIAAGLRHITPYETEDIYENHELDPYGEEDWYDDIILKPGDKVICTADLQTLKKHGVKFGKKYTIKRFNFLDNSLIYLEEIPGCYGSHYFKKVVNEHLHYLMDDDDDDEREYMNEKVDLIGLPSGTYRQIRRIQLKQITKYANWSERLKAYVYRDKDENKILMILDPDSLF